MSINKDLENKPLKIDSDEAEETPLQKHLIPASNSELSELIGAEANYDRWSNFVFPHVKCHDLYERRKHEWKINLPDETKANARIEVIPAKGERCYTSKSYDVFLALVVIWKERGMPEEKMNISLTEIAKVLGVESNGRSLNNILDELSCLYTTYISWVFSFVTKDEEMETLQNQRVLDIFNFVKKKDRLPEHKNNNSCIIKLSEHIRENLRKNVTIPVNFKARKSIKSDVARTIYSRVDNIMATKDIYQRKATNIVSEYSLTAKRYRFKSQRKDLLLLIQRNLQGVETSKSNVFLNVEVQETADGKDWKCIFTTTGKKKTANKPIRRLPIVNKDGDFRIYLIDSISDVVGDREQNYGLYNNLALYYSENMIFRALGEYKELINYNPNIINKKGYFTTIMHSIAHKTKKEWIKECGKNCPQRPENQLFPDY